MSSSFEPGEAVVREGELGETLFVVLEGEGKVVRGTRRSGTVLPGDFFGELAAIDCPAPERLGGGRDTAARAAAVPSHLLKLLGNEPQITLKLLDGIVRRIRQVEHSA